MSGPIAGVPFIGCCGATEFEFVSCKLVNIRAVRIVGATDQELYDFVLARVQEYDMGQIPIQQQWIVTYVGAFASAPTTQVFGYGIPYRMEAFGIHTKVVSSAFGLQGTKAFTEGGPDAFPCRTIERLSGPSFVQVECGYGIVPSEEIIMPDITIPYVSPDTRTRKLVFYFGPLSNKPGCCPPSPP